MGSQGEETKTQGNKKDDKKEFPLWDVDIISKSAKTTDDEVLRELKKKSK